MAQACRPKPQWISREIFVGTGLEISQSTFVAGLQGECFGIFAVKWVDLASPRSRRCARPLPEQKSQIFSAAQSKNAVLPVCDGKWGEKPLSMQIMLLDAVKPRFYYPFLRILVSGYALYSPNPHPLWIGALRVVGHRPTPCRSRAAARPLAAADDRRASRASLNCGG